ncbi:MAG TPA: CHAD domain-containing protein [Alphaproteobacteria bacterium]
MTDANDPMEIELTLRLDPAVAKRLMRDPLLRKFKQGRRTTQRLLSIYFDTPDFRLRRQRATLRVRQIGGRRIQTVKLAARAERGILARHEWEREIDGTIPDLRDIDDRDVRRIVNGDISNRLAPVFVSEITRSVIPLEVDGSAIELAVDVGEIRTDRGRVPVCEAELELKSGHVKNVYRLAQELNRRMPLSIEPMSKAERGYALAANAHPPPRKADPVRLDPDMTAGQAFQVIARNCLLHLRTNEASVRAEPTVEGVHQLRIAIRRFRSALSVFGAMLPTGERRRIGQKLRWIARQCARARELDVLLEEILYPMRKHLPDDAAMAEFIAVVEDACRAARKVVVTTLNSREYTGALLMVEAWVESRDWQTVSDGIADQPVRGFARSVLKRLHRKLRKAGSDLEDLDETGLHALRIRAKKLRYAGEFFRGVFRDKVARNYLAAVTGIQDCLGTLNDGAVARKLVADLEHEGSPEPARFARAAGAALGWNACQTAADLKRLPAAWDVFLAARPLWK